MRETDLPSPGRFNTSYIVRKTIVAAISAMQVSKRPDGTHPAAADFVAFLDAAKAAVQLLVTGNPAPDPEA